MTPARDPKQKGNLYPLPNKLKIMATRSMLPDLGYQILATRCWPSDTGHQIAGSQILYQILAEQIQGYQISATDPGSSKEQP